MKIRVDPDPDFDPDLPNEERERLRNLAKRQSEIARHEIDRVFPPLSTIGK
jgi:hypothetical protein